MPSSTRSNKDKHLLFSEDPAHLEHTIRKDQRSTSLDAAAFTSTDSRTQPSTDARPSSSTDLHRSTSIDTTPRTSIDHQSRNMVAIVILRQDENGNLYDQDGHLRHATDDDFWQVVKHEKLGEGDYELESSMSFDGSQWYRPMSMYTHRSIDHDEDRSTDYSTLNIDRRHLLNRLWSVRETDIDRPPSPPIDRRAPLTYRVRLPSIDNNRINALRPPPKPLANPPEPTTNPSHTTPEPMRVDEETGGRRLRKRKEKIPKNLKREANEKEMNGFIRESSESQVTKETEEDIRKMFHYVREMMKLRITLKKKSDSGKFAIPCVVKACHCGAEYETEYSESIDTHIASSIDSNESPTTDDHYPTSLDRKHPVDHFTLPDQCYPDFAFQQPNKKGRDDYLIGSWEDSGFHESFAVETVILSSNEDRTEDRTEEYDEDYWKERATEIGMQDDKYSTHSFNKTPPPSIDCNYSASIDTHPHPAKRSYSSIDTTPGT
ncbi:hypothetical protein F2Q69_00006179 [Brassica cretica]|uniref:Uncharacterized protein n=1 Tax=Brassica cretica TaxID=69181 RepID=A0A8S9P103_BRACR|nr:hypothetical protein F2Q69_00006179 [Brassica cretica]